MTLHLQLLGSPEESHKHLSRISSIHISEHKTSRICSTSVTHSTTSFVLMLVLGLQVGGMKVCAIFHTDLGQGTNLNFTMSTYSEHQIIFTNTCTHL
jgi:hypothetical protein